MNRERILRIDRRIKEMAEKYFKALSRKGDSSLLKMLHTELEYLKELRGRLMSQE